MTDHNLARLVAPSAEDPSSAQAAMPAVMTPHGYYTFVPFALGASPDTPALTPALPSGGPMTASADLAVMPVPNPHVVTGIPDGLAALLRWTGPWSANVIYSVAPTGPLAPVEELTPAPEWYCIFRGRFVGVVDQFAQAHYAIRNVSNAAQKAYTSQAFALDAFNKVVAWGGIEVV